MLIDLTDLNSHTLKMRTGLAPQSKPMKAHLGSGCSYFASTYAPAHTLSAKPSPKVHNMSCKVRRTQHQPHQLFSLCSCLRCCCYISSMFGPFQVILPPAQAAPSTPKPRPPSCCQSLPLDRSLDLAFSRMSEAEQTSPLLQDPYACALCAAPGPSG